MSLNNFINKKLFLLAPFLLLAACATEGEEASLSQDQDTASNVSTDMEEDDPSSDVSNDANEVSVSEEDVENESNSDSIDQQSASSEANTENDSSSNVVEAEPIRSVLGGTSRGITPTKIEIPAINVDAVVDGVGLEPDGAMSVPDDGDTVGWFNRGAKPGAQGNSVLAGHVDDLTGPAIFFDLKDLEAGDEIIITGENGDVLTFQVMGKESYPYDDAPIDLVFGGTSSRNLNLITCTGEFDRNVGTHRERLVVFTELVDDSSV
ncbi:sortase [Paenalkalicoccus suaedae]|uniref:Sortase n=1 Tax=Paenalkalicoccus suaedae TaxID=2592382 RepID=A0A859FBB1_9BACI|nr:class F sortase [Paenalkalicoccus suaedae]QKS70108.1 sortase [Paenalkalicoccus suaedae]